MLIGELSAQTGLSKETIRFYEKEGLIQSESRRENRYRDFSEQTVHTIHFIRNLKELGFTLSQISDFIHLFYNRETECHTVQTKLEEQLNNINAKITLLKSIGDKIENAIALCQQEPNNNSCHTLEKLWK